MPVRIQSEILPILKLQYVRLEIEGTTQHAYTVYTSLNLLLKSQELDLVHNWAIQSLDVEVISFFPDLRDYLTFAAVQNSTKVCQLYNAYPLLNNVISQLLAIYKVKLQPCHNEQKDEYCIPTPWLYRSKSHYLISWDSSLKL